jgi:hypothetical protein
METLRIDKTDVILKDYDDGQGKIIISNDDFGYNFSFYWGSMGKNTNIKKFLQETNSSYFVNKLGLCGDGDIDVKRTVRNIRKYIREEMDLPWYKHMEFQKDMRERLNNLEGIIYSPDNFVYVWDNFVKYSLDYYLIDDKFEREEIESAFKGICEPWYFIANKEHRENIWLDKFHEKLVKHLKS